MAVIINKLCVYCRTPTVQFDPTIRSYILYAICSLIAYSLTNILTY